MTTPQNTFDLAVSRILEQNCFGLKDDEPAYRGDNGTKCIVGHLIPDENYSALLEGYAVDPTRQSSHLLNGVLEKLGHNLLLVKKLQDLHDNCALNEDSSFYWFVQDLRELANLLSLEWEFKWEFEDIQDFDIEDSYSTKESST